MNTREPYDLAVVGGGIAGLYCALNAPGGMKVALFEGTDRMGGKLETGFMEGFQAEWGSMRFDPGRQYVVGKLLGDLRLETQPFPEYSSPPDDEGRAPRGLQDGEKGLTTLQLFALGIARILGKSIPELLATPEEELEHIRKEWKHRERPLWQYGIWNLFVDVLSYEAIRYIMTDGSFFHGIHENPGAAGTMITWVKMLQMSPHLKGVRGGMQQITDRMLEKVKERGAAVYTGRRLEALSAVAKGKVALDFNEGTFMAGRVILALPAGPLKLVKGIPPDITAMLDTVFPYPLLKCFFVVKDPWWDEDIPNRGVTTFPARELHYSRRGNTGIIMLYADRPSINFWRGFVGPEYHDRAATVRNQEMARAFAHLMKISPQSVIACGIRDWTREPYGAGVHLWKAGVKPWEVMSRLEAFSLAESSPENVHICGEAFSSYQGFMEGALRSAHSVLGRVGWV